MKKINEVIDKNILKIVLVFLFCMPFLDLMTSLLINILNISFNYIIILKVILMLLLVYYVFFITHSKYKKKSIIYLILICIYCCVFAFITLQNKPTSFFMYEINNLIRTFYFPINLICIFNIYSDKEINIDLKKISAILFIYILIIFIPTITNLGFDSYEYSKLGTVGWFNSTNEIGGILSILLPCGLVYLFKTKNIKIIISIIIIGLYTYFSLGTKVPILSIFVIIFIFLIKCIYEIIKLKKYKLLGIISSTFILLIILGFFLIPKTSFYKNIVIHLEFLNVDEITDLASPNIIDKFIFSDRISYYTRTKINYKNAPAVEKIFGIGYSEIYFEDINLIKTIEMDYFDIFFRHGIVGFILFFIPFIYVLKTIFIKLKDIKKMDNELLALLISIILILVLSLFSGHILVAPSVSIFVIIILLMTSKKLEVM